MTVLGDRRAQDLRIDLVTVANRLLERFDDDDRAAFSSCVTVSGLVESLAPAVRTEKSALRFRDRSVGTDHDVDAAGKGDFAFAVPNALRRKVYRDSELEHAVSIVMLGPRKSNANEILLASIVIIIPVAEWVLNR